MGAPGRAELRIAGEAASDPLELSWSESLDEAASLTARLSLEDNRAVPSVGDKIELEWRTEGPEEASGKLVLWCAEVRIEHEPGSGSVQLIARDPSAFAQEEPQFHSYAGRVSVIELAKQVLAFQPGKLEGMEFGSDACGKLPQEYVLQAGECGRDFLARIAHRAGAALFWDRERFVVARAGSPTGERIDLKQSAGLRWVEHRTPEPGLRQLYWLDPVTRNGQATAVKTASWSGANGARGLARAAQATAQPEIKGWIGDGIHRAWNGSLEVASAHAGIRIGSIVELSGGRTAAVESIQHSFAAVQGGNYQSRCRAVPNERWGIQRGPVSATLLGPFQAVVMENDDPERLGRIRVAFSEDPERRVTPWLPALTASGGNETGLFWVPEKDSLVLVAAPGMCPEAMFVLGGLRGDRHRVPAEWRSSKNARKAIAFRNGVRILVDDEQQTLRFETQGGSWQLDGHGLVKVNASQYDAHFDQTAKLEAGERVAIDATRIDLG
jgi:hypothetical protein